MMNCGFSLNHYQEIIETARDKGYNIIPVRDFHNPAYIEQKKIIVVRHDIDFFMDYAYELASFEYDLGITSSYYVLLHSPTYNALAPESMRMIEAIRDMGHEIGLHYDSRYSISHESDILNSIIRKSIYSYSQHLPGFTSKETYQGLFNVWELNDDLKYLSDSGRNWREGCVCQHLGKENKIHLLTHPIWWITEPANKEEALHKLWLSLQTKTVRDCSDIKQLLYEYYRDDLKKGGIKLETTSSITKS